MKFVVLLVVLAACVATAQQVCPTAYSCIPVGGNCTRNSPLESKSCIGSSKVTINGRCTCVASSGTVTDTTNPGDDCDDLYDYSPRGYHTCRKSDVTIGVGIQPLLKWYKSYTIGDACTNNYWCSPPRQCISGRCAANLAIGDMCYNSTYSYDAAAYGMCPVNSYCKTTSSGSFPYSTTGVCTARIAVGGTCSGFTTNECTPPSTCDYSHRLCMIPQQYFVLPGQKANSSSQCTSGEWNTTSYLSPQYQTCLDLDVLMAAANAVAGTSCTTSSQCGGGYCDCNDRGSSNRLVCFSDYTQTVAQKQAAYAVQLANSVKLYTTGCESSSSYGSTTDFCRFRANLDSSNDDDSMTDYCLELGASIAAGQPDCSGMYSFYCGALHTMTVSFAAIVAMVMFAWLGPVSA